MIETVRSFIKKKDLLKKQTTVLVGISGGPDSVALLHVLKQIQPEYDLKLIAVTIDHQLRGEVSRLDSLYVDQLCNKWNIECVCISVDVLSYKSKHALGTQVACRHLRYEAFAEQMEYYQADYLALGHHGDDQAETMLMQFSRAASPVGVKGIPLTRDFANGQIIRPLLAVNKQEILDYLQNCDIQYRIDATNAETDYTRNEFRHHIIPILKEKNPNLHRTTQHLSEAFHEDAEYLLAEAERVIKAEVQFHSEPRSAQFKIESFKSYPIPLQRRAFHLILSYLYSEQDIRLSYVHETDFFAILEETKGNVTIDLPKGLKMLRIYGEIVFAFRGDTKLQGMLATQLQMPGLTQLQDGSSIECIENCESSEVDENTYVFPLDAYSLPLFVRTPLTGDRMCYQGLQGTKKLSRIFIDLKIPRHLREFWPIVVDSSGKIVWLIGLKKSVWKENKSEENLVCLRYENSQQHQV